MAPTKIPDPLTGVYQHIQSYGLGQAETRTVQNLVIDAFADAYEKSGTDLPPEDFRSMIPASVALVLVDLLAPMADAPHYDMATEFTRYVLTALADRIC